MPVEQPAIQDKICCTACGAMNDADRPLPDPVLYREFPGVYHLFLCGRCQRELDFRILARAETKALVASMTVLHMCGTHMPPSEVETHSNVAIESQKPLHKVVAKFLEKKAEPS